MESLELLCGDLNRQVTVLGFLLGEGPGIALNLALKMLKNALVLPQHIVCLYPLSKDYSMYMCLYLFLILFHSCSLSLSLSLSLPPFSIFAVHFKVILVHYQVYSPPYYHCLHRLLLIHFFLLHFNNYHFPLKQL